MAQKVISVLLNAITGPYQAAMGRAAATTTGFGTAAKGASGQVGGLGQSTGALTKGLLGGAALVAGVKMVTDAAIGWESAFADVRKTVEGTPEQLEAINSGLRDMSTELPTSKEELAGIAASAGQLGIQTDNVLDFTRVIADLGETTNLAGQQGATELARFANITGMAQGDFDRLGSTIVDLGNNFATTEAEISEMALRIAGAGAQIGLSEADVLGFATALSSVGIRAQAGGSAISKVMIDIANEVETGGDKLATFAQVSGMSAGQFSEAWREDAAGALVAFIEGLGGMEDQGGSALQVLEELEITEVRMRDALLRASGAGDLLADAIDTGNAAWEENIALTEEANLRYETTEAKLDRARNAISNLATDIGEQLLPAIGSAAGGLADLFNFQPPGGRGVSIGDLIGFAVGATVDPHGVPEDVRRIQDQGDSEVETSLMFRTEGGQSVQDHIDMIGTIPSVARPAQRSISDMVGPYSDLADAADDALESQQAHAEWVATSTDPILQLNAAIDGVAEAQANYDDVLEDSESTQQDVQEAAFGVLEAVRDVELAVLDGDLSWQDFEQALRRWVDMGVITEGQADTIRERVSELREESERYSGDYHADFTAATEEATEKIRGLLEQIRSIPGRVHVDFTADGNVIVRRPGQGGGLPVGDGGTTTGNTIPDTGGSSAFADSPGRMHAGGVVAGTAGTMDGLAPDERLRILQLGETVLPRHMDASRFAGGASNVVNNNQQVVLQGQPDARLRFEGRQWLKRMAA